MSTSTRLTIAACLATVVAALGAGCGSTDPRLDLAERKREVARAERALTCALHPERRGC